MSDSMQITETLALLLSVALVLAWASRLVRVPYPVALVVGGIGIGFIPGIPVVTLDPQLVLLLFVAPLLYADAFFAPVDELRRNVRWVGLLATALVVVTAAATALASHLILSLPWGVAFALGAGLAATDAVAPMQVLGREGADPRLVAVIQGESLLNDGVAFTLVKVAATTVVTGSFSFVAASGQLGLAVVGGLLAGVVVAFLVSQARRHIKDPMIEAALSLITPFAAYILADRLGASGILAAVAAGLWIGRRSQNIVEPLTRVEIQAAWRIITFILNSILFLLVGLQLKGMVRTVDLPFGEIALGACGVLAVLVGTRLVWALLIPSLWQGARGLVGRDDQHGSGKGWRFALAWSGVRGSVALAAALSLPATIHGGAAFPARNLVILMTLIVIIVTLLAQGLTLRPVLQALGLTDERAVHREQAVARETAADAALAHLDEAASRHGLAEEARAWLAHEYGLRSRRYGARASGVQDEDLEERHRRVAGADSDLLASARQAVIDLEARGDVRSDIAQLVLRDLDLDSARLSETGEEHATP
ncbi:MAG: Na+/H+ antiporter [Thermoleophilaceae bacterium]